MARGDLTPETSLLREMEHVLWVNASGGSAGGRELEKLITGLRGRRFQSGGLTLVIGELGHVHLELNGTKVSTPYEMGNIDRNHVKELANVKQQWLEAIREQQGGSSRFE